MTGQWYPPLKYREVVRRHRIVRHWDESYTCPCGHHVHPDSPHTSGTAFHLDDCPFRFPFRFPFRKDEK